MWVGPEGYELPPLDVVRKQRRMKHPQPALAIGKHKVGVTQSSIAPRAEVDSNRSRRNSIRRLVLVAALAGRGIASTTAVIATAAATACGIAVVGVRVGIN